LLRSAFIRTFDGVLPAVVALDSMLTSTRGNSFCPKCGEVLDGVTVVRYGQSFRCTACKSELVVPRLYLHVGFWIGLTLAVLLCIAMGLTKLLGFVVGLLVFLLPALFSVGILQRKLWPPKLVIYRDPNSLLS
jgi:hypothetical protein